MKTTSLVRRLGQIWNEKLKSNRRRLTSSSVALAAEIVEHRIVLSDTTILPPPNPADFGVNPNDPSSFSANNPGYQLFMAALIAYTNASAVSTPPTSSGSVLDNYANWFNGTLGSGWSDTAGSAIYTVLPVSDATLANTSDATLITGTTIVSIPLGIAIFAGGEVLLGVGTLGASSATAGTLTTVSTAAGTVHVSTVGTVATVEVGFVEAITPNLIHTITQTAISQGATTVLVNTGPVVSTDLAISLGLAAQTGTTVLGGTVTLIEGGAYPIFVILIPLL